MFWVGYSIFLLDPDELPLSTLKVKFEALSFALHQEIKSLCRNYMWYNDEIYFEFKANPRLANLSCLKGKVFINEGFDDEYFILFLLIKLSEQFLNIVIQIEDSDGPFLLFEGCDFLPENFDANRIFIHSGKVKFIQENIAKGLENSLKAISDGDSFTSDEFENAIFERLKVFQNENYNVHYCKCRIPKYIAMILYEQPQLISLAVNALSEYTPNQVEHLNIENLDFVSTSVKFSRTQYARLLFNSLPEQCKQIPNLLPHKNSTSYKEYELGLKITCGFQLAMNDFIPSQRNVTIEINDREKYLLFLHDIARSFPEKQLNVILRQNPHEIEAIDYLSKLREIPFVSNQTYFRKKILYSLCQQQLCCTYLKDIPDSDESWLHENFDEQTEIKDEQEQAQLLEKLLAEFQKKISTKSFDEFNRESSSEDEFNQTVEDIENDSSSGSEEFSENELEVLETLLNNPDLLMKVIERNSLSGADSQNQLLIQQLNCIKSLYDQKEEEAEESDDEYEDLEEDTEDEIELGDYSRDFKNELESMDIDKKTEIQ